VVVQVQNQNKTFTWDIDLSTSTDIKNFVTQLNDLKTQPEDAYQISVDPKLNTEALNALLQAIREQNLMVPFTLALGSLNDEIDTNFVNRCIAGLVTYNQRKAQSVDIHLGPITTTKKRKKKKFAAPGIQVQAQQAVAMQQEQQTEQQQQQEQQQEQQLMQNFHDRKKDRKNKEKAYTTQVDEFTAKYPDRGVYYDLMPDASENPFSTRLSTADSSIVAKSAASIALMNTQGKITALIRNALGMFNFNPTEVETRRSSSFVDAISQEALLKLNEHHAQLFDGLDFNHLPDGFYVKDLPADLENGRIASRVLCYDALFIRNEEIDDYPDSLHLQLKLMKKPVSEFNSIALYAGQDISLEKLKTYETTCSEAYNQVKKQPTIANFEAWLQCLELPDEQITELFAHQKILFDDTQVDMLRGIVEKHGVTGLKRFIIDYERIKAAGKESFFKEIKECCFDVSNIGSKNFSLAVGRYLSFSKEETIWFEQMYRQHAESLSMPREGPTGQFIYMQDDIKAQAGIDFCEMVTIFSDFLGQMRKIDNTLSLPERCPIIWETGRENILPSESTQSGVPCSGFNMRVALTRFLTILEHVRSPHEQLRITEDIELTHSGYYYAVVHEGLNIADGACNIKGKATVIQEGARFEFPIDDEHIYKISLKDLREEINKFLLSMYAEKNIAPEINRFEKLFLRYISNQEQRKDINSYKRIFKKIKNSPMFSNPDLAISIIPMMYIMTICTTQSEYEGDKFKSEQALEQHLNKMLKDFEQPDSVFKKTGGRIIDVFLMKAILNVSNTKTKAFIDVFNLDDLVEALSFQTERFSNQLPTILKDTTGEQYSGDDDMSFGLITSYFECEAFEFEKIFDILGRDVLYACLRNANHTKITDETGERHCIHISFFADNMQAIVESDLDKNYKIYLIQALSCLDNSGCTADENENPILDQNEVFSYVKKQLEENAKSDNAKTLNETLQKKLNILKSINSEKTKPAITVKQAGEWLKTCKATSETDIHLDFNQRFTQARFGKEYNDSMQDAFETEYQQTLNNIITSIDSYTGSIPNIPGINVQGSIATLLHQLNECKETGYAGLIGVIKDYTSGVFGLALSAIPYTPGKYSSLKDEIQGEILELYNRPLEMHARELVEECGLGDYEEFLITYQLRYVQKVQFDDKELDKKIEENSKKREEIKVLMRFLASIKDEELKGFLISNLAEIEKPNSPVVVKKFIDIFLENKKQYFHLKNHFKHILSKSDEEISRATDELSEIFNLYPEYSVLSQAKLVSLVIGNEHNELAEFMRTALKQQGNSYEKQALNEFFSMYLSVVREEDKEPLKLMFKSYKEILSKNPDMNFSHLFYLMQGLREKDSKSVSALLGKLSESEDILFVLHFLDKKGNTISEVLTLIDKMKTLDAPFKEELKKLLPIPNITKILEMIDKNKIDNAYQIDPYNKHLDIRVQVHKEDKEKFVEAQVLAIVRHGLDSEGHLSEAEGNELLANYRYLTQISTLEDYAITWPGTTGDYIVQKMSTDTLRNVSIALRKNLQKHDLSEKDQLKTKLQYLAVMREAYYRSTGYFPYSTQMLSVLLNMQNQNQYLFEQIQTGEGKGMIAALQAGLMQAQGYAVDVFSSDFDQLSRRDQAENEEFFSLLGVKTTLLAADSDKGTYLGGESGAEPGIHYTTASNVSLYQAARMLETGKSVQLSKKRACVCDESDTTVTQKMTNIFSDSIDGADPYSNPYEWLYNHLLDFIEGTPQPHEVDDFKKFLQTKPLSRIEYTLLEKTSDRQLEIWLNSADFVLTLEENKDFQIQSAQRELATEVKDISVAVILEEGTKKPLPPNAQWGKGVHQLLHLKLNREKKETNRDGSLRHLFPIDAESRSLTSETNSQVLSKYQKVLGISGSVRGSENEQEELFLRYRAHVFDLPTHNPSQKKVHPPKYFSQKAPYLKALTKSIQNSKKHKNQPVLILCEDFVDVEALREKLQTNPALSGYQIQVVGNEKDAHELEAKKIAAGKDGIITIATPRFGRGTDIKPTNKYGLKVIETYVATTRDSIQNQGRPARNGKPGEFQRIIDLETHSNKNGHNLSTMNKKQLAEYIDNYRLNSENNDIKYRKFSYQADEVLAYYLNYLDEQNFEVDDWKKMRAEIISSCSDIWDLEKEDCIQSDTIQSFSEQAHEAVVGVFKKFNKDFSLEPKKESDLKGAPDHSCKTEKDLSYATYHENPILLDCYFKNSKLTEDAIKAQSKLFFEAAQRQLRNMSHLNFIDRFRFRYSLNRCFLKLRTPKKKGGYSLLPSEGVSEMSRLFDQILTYCQHHIALHKINDTLLDSLLKPIIEFRDFFEELGGSKEDLSDIDAKQQRFVKHLCEHCSALQVLPIINKLSQLNPKGMPTIDDNVLYKKFEQALLNSMLDLTKILQNTSISISQDSSDQWDRMIRALESHKEQLERSLQTNSKRFSILYGFFHQSAKEIVKLDQYIKMATQFKNDVLPKLPKPPRPASPAQDRVRPNLE
jgi:hypothetical protein